MNRKELDDALARMNDEEFFAFVKEFGGDYSDRKSVARGYVHHPEWERRLCQLLGSLTEDEKKTQAAIDAAKSSKRSAIAAAISALIALLSFLMMFLSTNLQP
ncbi:MAG: hypothetical protein H8D22_06620 [Candidatus Cloacimonetes bacterium]|nr:hypothetical protein [Candidatus Cloacimonadota bacterium]